MENLKKQVVIQFVRMLYYEDSSDEDDVLLEKIDNYAELTVPYLTDKQFQMNFRMAPNTFEDLLRKMNTIRVHNNYRHVGYPRTSLEKETMILIWCLGNPESFRCFMLTILLFVTF
jgi:hypothetical protein